MKWSSDSGYVLDPGLVAIACQQQQHSTVTDQFCDKRCLLTSSEKDVIQIWYAIYNIHTNNMIFFMMSRANWGKVPFAHFHERVLQNSEVGKFRYWTLLLDTIRWFYSVLSDLTRTFSFGWFYSNVQFWVILLKGEERITTSTGFASGGKIRLQSWDHSSVMDIVNCIFNDFVLFTHSSLEA